MTHSPTPWRQRATTIDDAVASKIELVRRTREKNYAASLRLEGIPDAAGPRSREINDDGGAE